LVTRDGIILQESQRSSRADEKIDIILENIAGAINEMKQYAQQNNYTLKSVGLGTPGCVDVQKGFLKGSTPNFKYWRAVPITDVLQSYVDVPVFVDNDANVMALGESKFGAGIGSDNVICLTIGTGIGGGIIIDGKIYRGQYYAGGELGHMSIVHDGRKCNCGNRGCLEQYASASAIIRYYKDYSGCRENDLNVKVIFERFHAGDESAKKAINEAIYYLGRGLANFINIFNPSVIILGGGVAEAGDIYIDKVEEITFQYAMKRPAENVRILGAKLGNKAGFLGAASYAFDRINHQDS
jgi:glucokinase